MAIEELYGSKQEEWNQLGGTGTRIFKADYATWMSEAPRIGSAWPGKPMLRLKTTRVEALTPNRTGSATYDKCLLRCEYSTAQFIDDAPVENGEISGEVLETGLGRTWFDTGRPATQSFGVVYPMMDWNVRLTMRYIPKAAILANTGRVNWAPFLDFPPQTLLFQGATWDNRYDYERYEYIFSVTFKFTYRPRGWNIQWRAPEQLRTDGVLIYNEDGTPAFVDGSAGIGGWDRLEPPLYESGDFNPLFGWPPVFGDF